MDMLESLIELDKEFLLALNGSDSLFWDRFMWLYTGRLIWVPMILSLIFVIFLKGWKEALLLLLVTVLVATLCDQISSSVFKPFFERLRPSREPSLDGLVKLVNDYKGGRYGFMSSHAANSFGVSLFNVLVFRRYFFTFTVLLFAVINSYTRIYLGVHYPGDILAGALLGVVVGLLGFLLYRWLHAVLGRKGALASVPPPYREVPLWPFYGTTYGTVCFIVVAALLGR